MRAGINYQIRKIWEVLDGIGTSKSKRRKNSNLLSQSGQKVSDLVHSYNSKDEILRTAKDLAKHAKEYFNIKDMQAINDEIVDSYINLKIENELTYRSISTYISHLEKLRIALSKLEIKHTSHETLFSKESLINTRNIAKQYAIKNIHKNRAYSNLHEIFANLSSVEVQISFKLQQYYGLRVTEATKILQKQLKENNILEIQGKGGYKQKIKISKVIYDQLLHQIKKNGSHYIQYAKYLYEFKKAVAATKQTYWGTHGIRYNYAQKKLNEYKECGMSELDAKQKVSNDLGHNRIEITEHYLK